jgi:two-component system nitrogen regulation response regulator GlnG/two-component system response regulator HydG
MLHQGVVADEALVGAGETLSLADTAVFVVERRSALWLEDARMQRRTFVFGGADEDGIVGESSAAWQLRAEIDAAANAAAHVLIHGASGAGKELAARAVHRRSARRAGPFVSRNAATLPHGLIDAELFGNIKNYPNAGSPERAGLVGEAEGGTLLLDEIGELPVAEQAHLLRLLDRGGEYQRLGDAKVRRANIRVIALTNRELGSLKADVLARFPIRIRVPSFAERPTDIPLFLQHVFHDIGRAEPALLQRFSPDGAGVLAPLVEPRLVELLLRHPLEGNHRELEQLARLAFTTSTGRYVQATARVMEALGAEEPAPEAAQLDRGGIAAALEAAGGSPTLAAQRLGLKNRHVLYRLMKKYGIESKG